MRYLAIAAVTILILMISACGPVGQGSSTKTRLYAGVPIPKSAQLTRADKGMGPSAKSWQTVFSSRMSMKQAFRWYKKELKTTGWEYRKYSQNPRRTGYAGFNIKDKGRRLKIIIVDEGRKTGANILISGGL